METKSERAKKRQENRNRKRELRLRKRVDKHLKIEEQKKIKRILAYKKNDSNRPRRVRFTSKTSSRRNQSSLAKVQAYNDANFRNRIPEQRTSEPIRVTASNA